VALQALHDQLSADEPRRTAIQMKIAELQAAQQ
jgi:cytochrome c-type biogenesis protein CcmH/NrfG